MLLHVNRPPPKRLGGIFFATILAMRLKSIEVSGFKSFAKKTPLTFDAAVTAVVGPNGSGKSNVAESLRFALGEQSMKSMRGRRGEDMIWNGGASAPRANRASVRMVFDNTDRAFNLDFDEVVIERAVNRDGSNEYILNSSQVRLRDIAELLAGAGIGASSHHIISQGEADRVLNANSRERRAMIEDALGLTAYIYKREEAERKIGKTAENIREVEGLRRELAPHLKFLASQVRKIEDGRKLLDELEARYSEYLVREHHYLTETKKRLAAERGSPEREKEQIDRRIEELRRTVEKKGENDDASRHIAQLERALSAARHRREGALRELGRTEGEIAAASVVREAAGDVPRSRVLSYAHDVIAQLQEAEHAEISAAKSIVQTVLRKTREFIAGMSVEREENTQEKLNALTARKRALEEELESARAAETDATEKIREARAAVEKEKDTTHEAERALFAVLARRGELEAVLGRIASGEATLATDGALFESAVREAIMLVPSAARNFAHVQVVDAGRAVSVDEMLLEPREAQRERLRKLERLKIRAEETLGSNAAEIEGEYAETAQRDAFLAGELSDLAASLESLRGLIDDITATLETRFGDGIDKINAQFNDFFKLLFGGGEAKLRLVQAPSARRRGADEIEDEAASAQGFDEPKEDEIEEGIEISVSLPHKRVKGLHMLSGGERALTSIALIFAMSTVNPPPFLILDETDAALDEANSRRYGDILEILARSSQLIVITHNRETMSRASVLYGITMGRDGISKLLSVKFEEALAVAK